MGTQWGARQAQYSARRNLGLGGKASKQRQQRVCPMGPGLGGVSRRGFLEKVMSVLRNQRLWEFARRQERGGCLSPGTAFSKTWK